MEKIKTIWLGGINPPAPFLEQRYASVDFRVLDNLANFQNLVSSSDVLVISDVNKVGIKALAIAQRGNIKTVLIRNEPKVVCPRNYHQSIVGKFDGIIDVGRTLRTTSLTVPYAIPWPSDDAIRINLSKPKRPNVVFMNSNKLSFVKGELYSLRRRALKNLEAVVYGPNWASSKKIRLKILAGELYIYLFAKQKLSIHALGHWFSTYKNYRGLAENKLWTLSDYKVALTIENSADYMSEKLLESLLSGCIPVYVGPKASEFGVPENLVVPADPNLESVIAATHLALSMDYNKWSIDALDYLLSATTQAFWSQKRIYDQVLHEILREQQ